MRAESNRRRLHEDHSKNARQWLDVIWELLLIVIPEPEKEPQLRKLGQHPSRMERAYFGERKLNTPSST
jgi:hypothetical protein